jgi:MFS transporter, DHA1 family, multidrug resistance protein
MVGPTLRGPLRVPGRLWLGLMIGALTAFGPMSVDMYLPALPRLANDLHASAALGQLTIAGFLVGLGAGQLLLGPLSDAFGRRRPLLVGLAIYVVATLMCAVAPSIYVLIPLRVLQGVCAAAGVVIARAITRDLYSGVVAARFFSRLVLVTGLAPVAAPVLGAQILRFSSWRGVFGVLGAVGLTILVVQAFRLPETLPPDRRRSGGIADALRLMRSLLGDRVFVGLILTQAFSMGALLAYIGGSSFVLQNVYGLSPQLFGVVFGVNALGLVGCAQLNAFLVGRYPPWQLLTVGRVLAVVGAGTLLVVVVVGHLGVWAILPALFLTMASNGFVLPNTTVLALETHPAAAGTAAALLGAVGYAAGAGAAPLAGVAGSHTALPMAIVIAAMQVCAGAVLVLFRLSGPLSRQPALAELPVEAIVPVEA